MLIVAAVDVIDGVSSIILGVGGPLKGGNTLSKLDKVKGFFQKSFSKGKKFLVNKEFKNILNIKNILTKDNIKNVFTKKNLKLVFNNTIKGVKYEIKQYHEEIVDNVWRNNMTSLDTLIKNKRASDSIKVILKGANITKTVKEDIFEGKLRVKYSDETLKIIEGIGKATRIKSLSEFGKNITFKKWTDRLITN